MNTKLLTLLAASAAIVCLFLVPAGDAEGAYVLTAGAEHGTVTDASTGLEFHSSPVSGSVTLKYQPIRGYEFREWSVKGDCAYSQDGSEITVSGLKENVTVTAQTRYYSTSQELINIVDVDGLPLPGDTLINNWSIKSENLDMSGGMWKGMPCTPLIVDETVYVRAGGMLYAMDITTGTILASVRSQGLEVDYYHYLSYGNGVIFDTTGHAAYDLELNKLYDLPSSLRFVTYHDGCFFGCSYVLENQIGYYTMFKTTLDKDSYVENGVKQNMFSSSEKYRLFAQYGQFGNVLIVGDWFFFLEADGVTGKNGYRAITAFNIKTEESVTCELEGIKGMPWDDGWLTYYNGYFYVTAYTAGLFDGVIQGLEDKRSSVTWVKFDFGKGTFGEPECDQLRTPDGSTFRGIASGLVIHNGRGYVNVRALGTDTLGGSDDAGTCMIAYDISEDGTPVPSGSAPSYMTHGGIVVNIAHEDEGLIHVYMVPYNSSDQAVYVFTDELKDGKWTLNPRYSKLTPTRFDWCSQCIRSGPGGELVYYVDSGYLDCYVKARSFETTIILDSGEAAEVNTVAGATVKDAVSSVYSGAVFDGGTVSIGGKTYSAYGLNIPSLELYAWESLTDLSAAKFVGKDVNAIIEGKYQFVVLLEDGAEDRFSDWDDAGCWYYFDGRTFSHCVLYEPDSIRAASGKTITYSETEPHLEPADIWPGHPASLSVARESSADVALPGGEYYFAYESSDPYAVSVSRIGNTMAVTGLKEKQIDLTVLLNGMPYLIKVTVLPKTYTENGNTVTESEREELTQDGGRAAIVSRTVEHENGSAFESSEKIYDSGGKLVSVRVIRTSSDSRGDFVEGVPVAVENTEDYTEDASGKKIEWNISEKRTTVREGLGTVETSVLEVIADKIKGKTVTRETLDATYPASIVRSSTVTTEENGKSVTEGSVKAESKSAGAAATVPSSALDLVPAGGSLPISLGTSGIVLSGDAVNSLKGKGDITFSVSRASGLNSKMAAAAGDAKVFSIILSCGGEEQHDFGRFSASVSCDLDIQSGKELKVWRIDSYGKKTYAENVSYRDGKAYFESDHLSVYAIGYEKEEPPAPEEPSGKGGDNTMLIAGGIAVAVIALLAVLLLARSRKG